MKNVNETIHQLAIITTFKSNKLLDWWEQIPEGFELETTDEGVRPLFHNSFSLNGIEVLLVEDFDPKKGPKGFWLTLSVPGKKAVSTGITPDPKTGRYSNWYVRRELARAYEEITKRDLRQKTADETRDELADLLEREFERQAREGAFEF